MRVADRVTECKAGGERAQAPDQRFLLEFVAIIEYSRDGFFNRGVAVYSVLPARSSSLMS